MSIASEISRIQQNISDSLTAVANKGVTVPAGSNSDDLAGLIAQITGGGGSGYTRVNVVPSQSIACTQSIARAYGNVITNYNDVIYDNKQYIITFDGTDYVSEGYRGDSTGYIVGDYRIFTSTTVLQYMDTPFAVSWYTDENTMYLHTRDTSTHTVAVDELVFLDSGTTLVSKTITSNGTYDPEDDNADGYASITVNVSGGASNLQAKTNINPTTSSQTITPDSGYDALSSVQINAMPSGTAGTPSATKGTVSNHSVSVTPSVTNTTGYITGSTKTGTAVTVTASELASGNKEITANGTNIDVVGYSTVSVAVPSSGSSKNVQTSQVTTRRNNTALGSINSLTCSTAGTYEVYWTCARSNTSQTWGSQLYIGGVAYDTENTTWSNNVQNNHLTGVSISANQTVAVYGRSRSGYYIYAPQLTIIQTS